MLATHSSRSKRSLLECYDRWNVHELHSWGSRGATCVACKFVWCNYETNQYWSCNPWNFLIPGGGGIPRPIIGGIPRPIKFGGGIPRPIGGPRPIIGPDWAATAPIGAIMPGAGPPNPLIGPANPGGAKAPGIIPGEIIKEKKSNVSPIFNESKRGNSSYLIGACQSKCSNLSQQLHLAQGLRGQFCSWDPTIQPSDWELKL